MAIRTTPLLPFTLLLSALAACAGDEPTPDDDAPGQTAQVTQERIAEIVVGRNTLTFLVDVDGPDAGAVTLLEKIQPDDNGEFVELSGERSVLATFLALTSPEVAVPEALLDASHDDDAIDAADGRALVDRHADAIHPGPTDLTAEDDVQAWSAVTMCNEGQTSAMFLEEICSMTDWTYDYCHNGTWTAVTDDPDQESHWSRSRTLACFGSGRSRHYYKFGGIWYEGLNNSIPSTELHVYTREAITLLKRRIRHSANGSGFVRGASHFAEW